MIFWVNQQNVEECLLTFQGLSGAKAYKSSRCRKELEIWNLNGFYKFGGAKNPVRFPWNINLKCEARVRSAITLKSHLQSEFLYLFSPAAAMLDKKSPASVMLPLDLGSTPATFSKAPVIGSQRTPERYADWPGRPMMRGA